MTEKIIFSDRKTLAVEISRYGEVIVRAPFGTDKKYIEKILSENSAWIEKKLAAHSEPTPMTTQFSEEEEKRLRELAKQLLPEKINKYKQLLSVEPTRITVTAATTRFGSCSGKNAVSFSFRLFCYSEQAVDYVVVHELAHIKEHNHSPKFWALVESVMPDYKQRRKLLKASSHI